VALPTLVVPEDGVISDSAPSSPRSASPSRSETPPLDSDPLGVVRSESTGLPTKKRTSHTRSGHQRKNSKPKDDAASDSSENETLMKQRSEGSIKAEDRSSHKPSIVKPTAIKPSSGLPAPSNQEKTGQSLKRAASPRSTPSVPSPTVAGSRGTPFHIHLVLIYPFRRAHSQKHLRVLQLALQLAKRQKWSLPPQVGLMVSINSRFLHHHQPILINPRPRNWVKVLASCSRQVAL
jgi:hypothetical protein